MKAVYDVSAPFLSRLPHDCTTLVYDATRFAVRPALRNFFAWLTATYEAETLSTETLRLAQTVAKSSLNEATENARPDIARLDNARPYSNSGHRETYFSVRVGGISVSNSFLHHLCVLMYTINVFFGEAK